MLYHSSGGLSPTGRWFNFSRGRVCFARPSGRRDDPDISGNPNTIQQLVLMTQRIEKLCEAADTAVSFLFPLDENVLLAKRTIEQQGRFPWKRRRIPLPLIPEEGTDV